jgi:hypothetical protein
MGGWNKSGTIWMKNIDGTKLREALTNHRQLCSKSGIWKAIVEHLNRYTNYDSQPIIQPLVKSSFRILPDQST